MTLACLKHVKRRPPLILGVVAFLATPACRKPAPDEVVFQGTSVVARPMNTAGATGGSPALGSGGVLNRPTSGATVSNPTGGTGGQPNPGSGGSPSSASGGSTPQPMGGSAGQSPLPPEPLIPRAVSCGGANVVVPFSKEALLGSIAECAVKSYVDFEVAARALSLVLAGTRTDTTPEQAWLSTQRAWQHAELFRFGPAGRSTEPGGRDLRDHIYGWPLISRCKIEEQLVSQAYALPTFSDTTINGRGLGALEYLLFYKGSDNACSAFSPINAGAWVALGPVELAQRKRAYALAAASDVVARANSLLSFWDPASGNFCKEVTQAGTGSTTFGSTQLALNAVSDALFYMDEEFKDWKLGRPSGLVECAGLSCPEAVEAPYAGASLDNLRANVSGFRSLFQGCGQGHSGLGFDDWLIAVGASDLNARMFGALDQLEQKLKAVPVPLEDLVRTDLARAQELHAAAKALTDLLKTEFVTLLNLDLPKSVEGDND
ncbi:MAG: imelysin family protein [Polyangiaceae bacterium]|nr:imelysin family protein [Polyangiaceae bacterium]